MKLLGFTGMHSSKTDSKGSIMERFWPFRCIYDTLKSPKLNCTFAIHRPLNSPGWYAMCHTSIAVLVVLVKMSKVFRILRAFKACLVLILV